MLDIVPVPLSPPTTTVQDQHSRTASETVPNVTPHHRNLRKVQSDARLNRGSFVFTSPGLDNFGDHHDYASWAFSSTSDPSTSRRPFTAKSSIGSQDSFTRLLSTRSRSSVSTGTETLLTPAQSSRDLVLATNPIYVEDGSANITFTRSVTKPLSADDIETLARIRAAYPDPNERSFATSSTIQRLERKRQHSSRGVATQQSSYYAPECGSIFHPAYSVSTSTISRSTPSPDPIRYSECFDWMAAPTELVYRLPELQFDESTGAEREPTR